MKPEPTVFIIDDDPAAADSLVALAQARGVRSESFRSIDQFLAAVDPLRVGCLVIDFNLLEMNGRELHTELATRLCHLPIILLDGMAGVSKIVKVMEEGAFSVIEKTSTEQVLWQKIELAIRSNAAAWQEHAAWVEAERRLATLTPGETEVLNRLISGQSNKQIAHDLIIGLRTVELRRARILEKMNAGSLPELVQLVLLARNPPSWRR